MEQGLRMRQATAADLSAVAGLRARVGWGAGGLEGSFAAAAAGRQTIFLAELDAVAVGTVTANFVAPGAGYPRSGHISDLVVAPRWRRRGIGSELLDAAEGAVRHHGLTAVTLDVDAGNVEALRLYLGRGYQRLRPARFPWGPGHTLIKLLAAAETQQAQASQPWWRALWPLRLRHEVTRRGGALPR